MKNEDAVAVVDKQIEAYVAGDTAAFGACYAIDAVCVRLPSGKVLASGRDEVETVWGRLFEAPDRRIRFELANRIHIGAFVTDHERIIRERDGAVTEAIAIYEVRDGLIARVWLIEPPADAA